MDIRLWIFFDMFICLTPWFDSRFGFWVLEFDFSFKFGLFFLYIYRSLIYFSEVNVICWCSCSCRCQLLLLPLSFSIIVAQTYHSPHQLPTTTSITLVPLPLPPTCCCYRMLFTLTSCPTCLLGCCFHLPKRTNQKSKFKIAAI